MMRQEQVKKLRAKAVCETNYCVLWYGVLSTNRVKSTVLVVASSPDCGICATGSAASHLRSRGTMMSYFRVFSPPSWMGQSTNKIVVALVATSFN